MRQERRLRREMRRDRKKRGEKRHARLWRRKKRRDLTKIDYACTLLHEILHAVVYYNSLTQSGQPLDNENKEETVVNSITNGLMAVFKDNPKILKELEQHIHNVR